MAKLAEKEAIYILIGRNIRRCRQSKNIKQEEIADKIGLSRASFVQIEYGRQRTPLHTMYDIAEALNVPLRDIIVELPEGIDMPAYIMQLEAENTALREENRYLRLRLERIRNIAKEQL